MKIKKITAVAAALAILTAFSLPACSNDKQTAASDEKLALSYTFDSLSGNQVQEQVSGSNYRVNYVFSNEENVDQLFKQPSDPLLKSGVSGNSLYMDGFSTYVTVSDEKFNMPNQQFTLSAWVAPRVFENLPNYDGGTSTEGHPRLTSVINKGDVSAGEGFVFGYGRLGLWGIQLALYNTETDEEYTLGFYDPVNALPLYEWSNIAATFNGKTGYIALYYNGEVSYEAIFPELKNSVLVSSYEPLYIGRYCMPVYEFGVMRQIPSGLLDEVKIYGASQSPAQAKNNYLSYTEKGVHPSLDFSQIALDSSVYEGDRYRPQYHAIPPAVWMNEPHSPFYYKGKYHVFYQHNPSGPYWSQIRWAHIVSDDMIHWEYVKDAVVPTAGICPEGVWTGGACIGPDGTPWLVITAGTNASTWSGQNVAFAHAADPDDPYLTDWIVEDKVVINQPSDNSQGERDQFRDPFVWYDDGTYYMMVSTSIPGRGGSANVYTSTDMREWEYRGYLYECDYNLYPEQGAHWECVVMLPISTKDGSQTKYILFDCPQYTVDGYIVDCYYWIGTFDKLSCRFIPDDPKPKLFDMGMGVYTGQNGYCFLTEEDIAAGKTSYTQGRTVIYAIAQGKDAGTAQNVYSGWAHNFAIPLELYLADNGTDVLREPIRELSSLYDETLYSYNGDGKTAAEINADIANIRGDMLEIKASFTISPQSGSYRASINVRHNLCTDSNITETTPIIFDNTGVWIDRAISTRLSYVNKQPSRLWSYVVNKYDVTILLDRSMLEVYVNGIMSYTMRLYPQYGDSDYLRIFDEGANIRFTSFSVKRLGSAYSDQVTPAYYTEFLNGGE